MRNDCPRIHPANKIHPYTRDTHHGKFYWMASRLGLMAYRLCHLTNRFQNYYYHCCCYRHWGHLVFRTKWAGPLFPANQSTYPEYAQPPGPFDLFPQNERPPHRRATQRPQFPAPNTTKRLISPFSCPPPYSFNLTLFYQISPICAST